MRDICDACKTVGRKMVSEIREGVLLRLCVDPVECRITAQKKGIWK